MSGCCLLLALGEEITGTSGAKIETLCDEERVNGWVVFLFVKCEKHNEVGVCVLVGLIDDGVLVKSDDVQVKKVEDDIVVVVALVFVDKEIEFEGVFKWLYPWLWNEMVVW